MTELLQLISLITDMNVTINAKLNTIEARLDRLEKMDSIEHRVEVNQIDLCDIKELLQKIDEHPTEKFSGLIEEALTSIQSSYQKNFELITKRLDAQLLKIAKTEEELLLIKETPYENNKPAN